MVAGQFDLGPPSLRPAHDGVTRQLGGTSLGSNIAPPLLCDRNNTLPVSGPGSLVREAGQLPALHQESRASQPRYSGAGQPLKSHIHGVSKRAPLSPSAATQHPQPTWTEHMAPASSEPPACPGTTLGSPPVISINSHFLQEETETGVQGGASPATEQEAAATALPTRPFSSLGPQQAEQSTRASTSRGAPPTQVPACKSRI